MTPTPKWNENVKNMVFSKEEFSDESGSEEAYLSFQVYNKEVNDPRSKFGGKINRSKFHINEEDDDSDSDSDKDSNQSNLKTKKGDQIITPDLKKNLNKKNKYESLEENKKDNKSQFRFFSDDFRKTKKKMHEIPSSKFIFIDEEKSPTTPTPTPPKESKPKALEKILSDEDEAQEGSEEFKKEIEKEREFKMIKHKILRDYNIVKEHNAGICFLHLFFKILSVFW